MNCQRRILGIRWFHFVTNASVTSQTGEEGLAIRICRRRLHFWSRATGSARRVVHGEIGCSNLKKTLAYLLVLPGSRARIVRCGGRYDPQLVKRSSEWVSEWVSDDYRKRHQPTAHYAWPWTLVQSVNRTSGRCGSASVDDAAERGCSRSRTTPGSTPMTPEESHMTASLEARYDPWPVKRSRWWWWCITAYLVMFLE